MKRTVYNTMIGLMLASGLAITSTGAMAQARRPVSTNNAAATGNRSVATAPRNNAATVTNSNNNVSSRTVATSVTPQVNRGTITNRGTTTTSGSSSTSGRTSGATSVRPSVGGTTGSSTSTTRTSGSSVSTNRSTGTSIGNTRTSGGSTGTSVTNNSNKHGTTGVSTVINTNTDNRISGGTTVRPSTSATNINKDIIRTDNNRNNGNGNTGGNTRPNVGGNHGNNNGNGNVRPNAGGNTGGRQSGGYNGTTPRRPDNRPKIGGSVMNSGGPKIDYSTFRYNSNARPRFAGDRFFNSYRYNSWSWANPIRPSVRPWRPTTIWVYRPIVTVNVVSYSSYPTIGGVLGLSWGTSFINALNYLYYNGYYIDGYMDNIVYLTDINLLGYDWDDVMLQFDGNDNFDYVQFVDASQTYDTSRFHSLYNYLCSLYGRPISYSDSMYSWYGGDGIGFVNLGLQYTYDYNYTVLAFGI